MWGSPPGWRLQSPPLGTPTSSPRLTLHGLSYLTCLLHLHLPSPQRPFSDEPRSSTFPQASRAKAQIPSQEGHCPSLSIPPAFTSPHFRERQTAHSSGAALAPAASFPAAPGEPGHPLRSGPGPCPGTCHFYTPTKRCHAPSPSTRTKSLAAAVAGFQHIRQGVQSRDQEGGALCSREN